MCTLSFCFNFPPSKLIMNYKYSLPQELNFEKEAQNIQRAKDYFRNVKNAPVVIPNGIAS